MLKDCQQKRIIFVIFLHSVWECIWWVFKKKVLIFLLHNARQTIDSIQKKMFMLIFINLKYDNEVENNKHSTIDRSNLSTIKWNAPNGFLWQRNKHTCTECNTDVYIDMEPMHAMPKCELSSPLNSIRCGNINHRPDADNTMIKSKPQKEYHENKTNQRKIFKIT